MYLMSKLYFKYRYLLIHVRYICTQRYPETNSYLHTLIHIGACTRAHIHTNLHMPTHNQKFTCTNTAHTNSDVNTNIHVLTYRNSHAQIHTSQ